MFKIWNKYKNVADVTFCGREFWLMAGMAIIKA